MDPWHQEKAGDKKPIEVTVTMSREGVERNRRTGNMILGMRDELLEVNPCDLLEQWAYRLLE